MKPGSRHRTDPGAASRHALRAAFTVLLDTGDDPVFTQAALAAHRLGAGRLVVHPTPAASHPPGLAQDVLAALGKTLPRHQADVPRHRAAWADMVRPAWAAAASWIHAQRIGHLILLRAHTQTPARWGQLTRLQRRTGIHLTLVWHDTPERLNDRAQAWQEASWALISEQEAAQQRLRRRGQRPALDQHGPNTADTKPAAHVVGWLQQIGHPLHAGLLAAQLACGQPTPQQLARVRITDLAPDATALALPHPSRYRSPDRTWHPIPVWARPALIAARAWQHHTGHPYSSRRLFQHTNFHHHNQLYDLAAAAGIHPAITRLTGDPAWPTPHEKQQTTLLAPRA